MKTLKLFQRTCLIALCAIGMSANAAITEKTIKVCYDTQGAVGSKEALFVDVVKPSNAISIAHECRPFPLNIQKLSNGYSINFTVKEVSDPAIAHCSCYFWIGNKYPKPVLPPTNDDKLSADGCSCASAGRGTIRVTNDNTPNPEVTFIVRE